MTEKESGLNEPLYNKEVEKKLIQQNKKRNLPLFKEVVIENDSSGELKTQVTVELNSYDTSEMEGYKTGNPVYKGHTCKIATLKPNKTHPRARIDINPDNAELRDAILRMYEGYDTIKLSQN